MGPMRFEVDLSSYGYKMKVDVKKPDCNQEPTPHWHLWHNGSRIGTINIYGEWSEYCDAEHRIKKEAEELTRRYASKIREVYENNRLYGPDY